MAQDTEERWQHIIFLGMESPWFGVCLYVVMKIVFFWSSVVGGEDEVKTNHKIN